MVAVLSKLKNVIQFHSDTLEAKAEQNLITLNQLDWFQVIYQDGRYHSLISYHDPVREFIGKADMYQILTNPTTLQAFREQLLFLLGREQHKTARNLAKVSR